MELSLLNFEQQIDETILKRGLSYFKKGCVEEVDALGHGDYEATVEGTDTYTVRLHLDGDNVTELSCTCPYDKGPVCKHMAAVLFHLQKEKLGIENLPEQGTRRKPKKESDTQLMTKLVEQLSREDLQAFVRQICVQFKDIRQLFLAQHMQLQYSSPKELYSRKIEAFIKMCSANQNFIEYREAQILGDHVESIANEADTKLKNGDQWAALYAAQAIIDNMIDALSYADDSSGAISSCIEHAFDILSSLSQSDLDQTIRQELFRLLVDYHSTNKLQGWDWHFTCLDLAINIVESDEEKAQVKNLLGAFTPDNTAWNWDYEQAQILTVKFIRKTEGNKAATRFMEDHISIPELRATLIQEAIEKSDYARAEQLATDGVKEAQELAPNNISRWLDFLLTIYIHTDNDQGIIQIATSMLVNHNERFHPMEFYYTLLQNSVPPKQWQAHVDKIIATIRAQKDYWSTYHSLARIYIWENRRDDLLALVRQYPTFSHIAQAEEYLADSHAEQLSELYKETILLFLQQNVNRSAYQEACRYIRHIIKLGQRPMATELIRQLKTLYPTRRALLEELNNV